MAKQLYDIIGQPIKVAFKVAFSGHGHQALHTDRVFAIQDNGQLLLCRGTVRLASEVVVLEEPVWPNL